MLLLTVDSFRRISRRRKAGWARMKHAFKYVVISLCVSWFLWTVSLWQREASLIGKQGVSITSSTTAAQR